FRDPNGMREAVVRCIQQTLEHARVDWQDKFRAPVRPGSAAVGSSKAAPDLSLRSEVTAPEATHRELCNLSSVAGVADPGRLQAPEIVMRVPPLPERQFDSAVDAPAQQPQQRITRPAQQQFEIIGV